MTTPTNKLDVGSMMLTDEQIVGLAAQHAGSDGWMNGDQIMSFARALLSASKPAVATAFDHTDDVAIDHFAVALKAKLAASRAKGRGGCEQCDQAMLSNMLREHVEKGDPRDVANFCMFLWWHKAAIAASPAAPAQMGEPEHSAIYISKRLTGSDKDASFVQAHINQAVSEAMDRCYAPSCGKWDGNDSCTCQRLGQPANGGKA